MDRPPQPLCFLSIHFTYRPLKGVYMPCLVAGDGGGKINIEGLRMAGRSPAASLKDIWLRGNAKELSILWKDTSSRIFVSGKTKTKEDSSA
nr:MAG TPA: hypothetical protein [Caudoviricetes sp.]